MRWFGLLSVLLVACSGETTDPPVPADGGVVSDAGTVDGGTTDRDGGTPDAGRSYREAVLASSWTRLDNAPSLTRGKQDDVYFTSPDKGFAVSGPAATIYRTEDGGETWDTVLRQSGTYFRSLLFVDGLRGFAGSLGPIPGSPFTDPNVLYQTDNGGDTWTVTSSIVGPAPVGVCNMTKIDDRELVAVGRVNGPSFLLRSSDSGATWTSTDLNGQLQMLIDTHFLSPTEGIVIGGSASNPLTCTILRTTDGSTFDTVFTSATAGSLCWKISFPTPDVGYVAIQYTANRPGTFAKTIDGGRTWTEMPLGIDYSSLGIGFITEDIGWVSSDDPTKPVLKTTDGGETWTEDPNLSAPLNRFRFVDAVTAYAIGGSVFKLTIDAD